VAQKICVNYDGASGPLDFDNVVGEARSDIGLWCIRTPPGKKVTFEPLVGTYYNTLENELIDDKSAHFKLNEENWCNKVTAWTN
jgi:hypothetical protein